MRLMSPLVILRHATVEALLDVLRRRVGLAGLERVAEDPDNLIGVVDWAT